MASTSDTSESTADSTPSRTPSKLESLSREDLLKFVKKQMVLLQKTKTRCEELTQELENARSLQAPTQDSGASDLVEEHQQLLEAYNQSQQSLEQSAVRISSMTEQVDCMTQKLETVTTLYQTLQTEFEMLSSDNKKLKQESERWVQKSEDWSLIEKQFEDHKQLLKRAVLDKEQAELKLAESCEALKACSMRLDELQKDHAQQQTELSEHVSEKNNLERELQAVQKTLNAKIAELTDRLNEKTPDSVVQELQQALDAAVKQNNELDAGKQQMLQECANLKQQLETAMANCADIVQTKETQDKNFDELKKTYEELNLQYINLSADVDESSKLKQLLNELEMERSGFQKTNEVLLKQIEELQCSLSSVQLDKNKLTDEKAVLVEQLRLCGKIWENVECSTQTNDPKLLAIPDEVNEIVKEVRAKINLRSEQLAKMQGEKEMLNDAYLKLQNDYASLHHELASERCQTEQLLAEKDLLARELSQMKESYKELPVCSESNQPQLQSMNISESLQASAANMDEEFLKSTCQSDLSESADSGPVVHERDAEIKQFGNTESQKHELDHAEVSGKGSSLPLETSESKFEELCAETCSSGADGNSSSSLTPTACNETTDGVKSDLDELAVARQKLIEWEAMMLMLQAERTETQGELIKLQKQQEEALDAVSKLLQYILDTLLKDRDIFPSVDQNSVDDESAILSKLSLVKSIVEEMGFERDEMKEKIHHNIEEIAALNEKFASLLKEKEQLMEKNVKLSGELESTQATRSHSSEKDAELLNSLKQIETERNDLQRQLDEKETKIQTLSGLVSDAEQLQLDMLAKEKLLADTNAEKEMWRDQCEGLQKRLDLCVTDSSSCVSDVQRLTSEVDRLLKENNHLSTDVQELTKDSQCNRMLFEEVQKKCEDECHRAAAIENALHKMQADFSACQEQNTSLMTKLGFAEKGNDDLQEENSKLTSSVSLLQERFDAAVAELEGVKCMKLTLENDMAALQVECKNRIESFEAQLVTASAKLTTAEEQLSDNASNLSRLEEELKQCREDLQVKCLSLQTAETELQNKTLELQQMHIALDQVKNASETNLQTSSEVTNLKQQLKEHEDRESKLKQLALKAKKEAAELKNKLEVCEKELESTRQDLSRQVSNSNQSLQYQAEYDKLEAKFDSEKQRADTFEISLRKAAEELSNLRMTSADWIEEKDRLIREIESLGSENKTLENRLAEKEREIRAEVIQREQIIREKAETESRALGLQQKLRELEDSCNKNEEQLQEQLKELKEKMSAAQRELQQSSMMDLEIADYERTVQNLHSAVAERESRIQGLLEELQSKEDQRATLQKLVDTSEAQYTQAEEHSNKLKQLLVKAKRDLAEAKKLENEQKTSDAQMKGKVEMLTQLVEDQKLQIVGLMADNHRLTEKMQSSSELNQRASRNLELKVQSLEHDLELARSELNSVQSEYESYKVRVHSVLKQQKTKSNVDAAVERDRSECQRLEKMIEQLRSQLQEQREREKSVLVENQLIQEEHERLQQRHTKLVADTEQAERVWRERLEKVNAENSANCSMKTETIQQLTATNESLTRTFKEQIQALKEEYGITIDNLRFRLENTELEIDRLRIAARSTQSNSGITPSPERDSSPDRPVEHNREMKVEERQSGEGSENTEDDAAFSSSKTSSTASQPTLVPFEQLLNTQLSDDASSRTGEGSEELRLKAMLAASEKHNQHLTVLLNESEAAVLRLTEQASVLKGEIRRLERNQERENSISNMEYLKNVVYKFLTLKGGSERMQLIPVLTTMLKFSPEEKEILVEMATGPETGGHNVGGERAGWGAYLNRWSGGLV